MNKDIFCYFEKDIKDVFNTYRYVLTAKMKKTVNATEFSELSFSWALEWDLKYNMNPGSCDIKFIPYKSGTAVFAHFSSFQLAGARYENYFNDINYQVSAFLSTPVLPVVISKDAFLYPCNYNNQTGNFKPENRSSTSSQNTSSQAGGSTVGNSSPNKDRLVFLSYSHKDKNRLNSLFDALKSAGVNIWYDAGIRAGVEWEEEIIRKLSECTDFLFFVTENSLNSQNCRDELYQARKRNKKFINILIDNVDLAKPEYEWFDFRYSRYQQVPAYAMSQSEIIAKILHSFEGE